MALRTDVTIVIIYLATFMTVTVAELNRPATGADAAAPAPAPAVEVDPALQAKREAWARAAAERRAAQLAADRAVVVAATGEDAETTQQDEAIHNLDTRGVIHNTDE